MRLKKGFTLAEILIVLMVIGAIATMTIPSLMKGVTETQWRTGLKKAYNTIVNLTAMERVSGALPTSHDTVAVNLMFEIMETNLAVKDYVVNGEGGAVINGGATSVISSTNLNRLKTGVKYTSITGDEVERGDAGDQIDFTTATNASPWINTDDGFSYTAFIDQVASEATTACLTKEKINSKSTVADMVAASCVVVAVDVNGLTKGPNIVEPQITVMRDTDIPKPLQSLTGDQYYIYIGRDGATAGPKKSTATGRIVADIK